MIENLKQIEKTMIISLLNKPEIWNSLLIDYHPPLVERLWTQIGNYRLFLHFIQPCSAEDALFHPHPWPSAMHVIKGTYEMGLGFGPGLEVPEKMCTILIPDGGIYYDMTHIDGWHYVRPIDFPCSTVMLTGKPWGREAPKSDEPLKPLDEERKIIMLEYFKKFYIDFFSEDIKNENIKNIHREDWVEFNLEMMKRDDRVLYSEFIGKKGFVIRHNYIDSLLSVRFEGSNERVDGIPSILMKKTFL